MPKRFSSQKQLPRKVFSQVQLKAHRIAAEGGRVIHLVLVWQVCKNSRVLEVRKLVSRVQKVTDRR